MVLDWLETHVIVGTSVSFTVTVKLQVAELLEASVIVHVTVVRPLLKTTDARLLPVPVVTPLNT